MSATTRWTAAVATALATWAGGEAAAAAPRVVASILPVHSLVAGVMAGIGEPVLLVEGGQSPHTYALRPSDARALQNADVVFWIGEDLETFLAKPLAALPRDARIVALHEAPGLTLLPYRADADDAGTDEGEAHRHGAAGGKPAGDQQATPHDADDDHDHKREHDHGDIDMHIWLSPVNAAAMVKAVVAALDEADPANAPRYQANGRALGERLQALDAALEHELQPVRTRPYLVFHDAYQYFEARYRLTSAGAITIAPERSPGAARLADIRRRIGTTGAVCVFAEPQFEPALIRTVIDGTGARTGVLDPLGAGLVPGPDAYFTLLGSLAGSMRGCLLPGS